MSTYSVIIKDYCFQRRLTEADTDDVVQEVMRKVSSAIKSFEYDPVRGRFRAWLGTVAANTIKSHLNHSSRRANSCSTLELLNRVDQFSDPDSAWVEIYSERIFHVACSRVKPNFNSKTWACFESTWIHQKPASQVAKEQEIPIHSVYVNKSRVLKKLESEVRHLAGDLPLADLPSAGDLPL